MAYECKCGMRFQINTPAMHIIYINICNCMWCMACSMLIIHIFSRLSRCRPTPQHTSTKLVLACSCITMDNPVLHHKTRPSIAIDLARFCLAMQTLSRTPSTARPLLLRAGRRRAREGLHRQTRQARYKFMISQSESCSCNLRLDIESETVRDQSVC